MSEELKVAIEAAKVGAETALSYVGKDLGSSIKDDNTIVTVADKATEEAIKSFINSKFPNAKFVGEETGGDIKEKEFWVIDPIDGTRSYSRGIPTWCVIVSLCRSDDVYLSVIYYPNDKSIYYAERNYGMFCNDKKVQVSNIASLDNAFIGYGSPRHFKNKQIVMDLINAAPGARSWEATFSGCLVSSGKMDVTVDAYGRIWDIAPFKVMVEEAGGKITRLDGSPWTFEGSGAVISNGLLHDEVLAIINKTQ